MTMMMVRETEAHALRPRHPGWTTLRTVAAVIVWKIGRDERVDALMLYPMLANFVLMGALLPWVYETPAQVDLGLMAVMVF